MATGTHAATIPNTARATYLDPANGPVELYSNTVIVQTVSGPSPATVRLFQYAPGFGSTLPTQPTQSDGAQCGDGAGGFHRRTDSAVERLRRSICSAPVPLYDTTTYHAGEPVFVTLTDSNRNADPLLRESIELRVTSGNGDEELLRLQETGLDTGVFAGGIQSARIPPPLASFDCLLSLSPSTTITADYVDTTIPPTPARIRHSSIRSDSCSTRSPERIVDGAVITLIDIDTGPPATVFGDDGTSAFPATITSGGTASDSSGTIYTFPPGGFRFPFVPTRELPLRGDPAAHAHGAVDLPAGVLANVRQPARRPVRRRRRARTRTSSPCCRARRCASTSRSIR